MALPDVAVRGSVVAVAVMLAAAVLGTLPTPDADGPYVEAAIWERGEDAYADGDPITLANLDGPAPQGAWGTRIDRPVVVVKLERDLVDDPLAIDVPGEPEHVLLAFDGKSTYLGCRVQLVAWFDADGDGQTDPHLLDVCHHAAYDPYRQGAHRPGTPGDGDLPQVKLRLDGDTILFGPLGPR